VKRISILLIAVTLPWFLTSLQKASPPPAEQSHKVDFDREIRPILADNCFACHGPDEKQRMANLRLDETERLFVDRGGYKIIVPGNSAQSKLYQKISSTDPAFRMPPAYATRRPTDQQIETVKEWIDQGAKWETHWAWMAPKRPPVPEVKDKSWVRNPIDNFVLARLEHEGLKPSPEADKASLLRRVSFDLTGLPPTPAELDSFLADKSPDAYEKRVDQLLASPRYGERMAVPWLDMARYADTTGYHIDNLRYMSHWRDWVINAFNQNMPFDEFTIKQLAGDLLPNATVDDKIASGFNRNHEINFEGGAVPAEYHVEYVVDRASTTAGAWLGLTMGCARCHDHKFDPIKQKDFYRFFAFFNAVPERGLDGIYGNPDPVMELPSPEQQRQMDGLKAKIAETLQQIPEKQMVSLENEWRSGRLQSMPEPPSAGLLAAYAFDGNLTNSSGHASDAKTVRGDVTYDDGAVRQGGDFGGQVEAEFPGAGDFDGNQPFALALWVNPSGSQPLNLLEKRDSSDHWRGYEISLEDAKFSAVFKRDFRVVVRFAHAWPDDAIEIQTKDRVLGAQTFESLNLTSLHHLAVNYDGSGKAAGLKLYLDGKPIETVTVKDHLSGSFRTQAALSIGNKSLGRPFTGQVDDFRIYGRPLTVSDIHNLAVEFPARTLLADLEGKPATEIASLQPEKPPAEADIGELEKAEPPDVKAANLLKDHQRRLSEYYLTVAAPESDRQLCRQLKDLRSAKEKLQDEIPTTMVMAEMKQPRDTFVLGRGQYDNPGEKVTPGVPSFLPPLPAGVVPNRLTLAKWILDPRNPLTARVAVNHFWQEDFGVGLVKTSEDFGSQGEAPSNPELLDWLATEFIRAGWDMKAMQRLIVTSSTFRQSSRVTPELEERDPENRLLARGPRFRLSAEEIRDNALAVSGLLNLKIGGPSVYPYQPKGIWEELAFGQGFTGQSYTEGTGPDLYRRSMYTIWKRTAPPPSLTTFDAPDREKCVARRQLTNTPLQALVLMNDPTYVEAGRFLAQRTILESGPQPTQRIDFMFRLATSRYPKPQERDVLAQLAAQEIGEYGQDHDAAVKLLGVGATRSDPKIDAGELAAWTTVGSAILSLDETISNR
jgi:Protein of unknown function (DUF1553)/Protein of unknown function (DUF1549)/Concanavalin A-like lectin/glucanases superfamily/Planctomycete cytochrome C